MGVTESENTLVLSRHGQWENVKFDAIQTLVLHGEQRPIAGLLTGAFLGSSAGVFLSYGSADSQSISTTFVTSLVTGMLLGLSIGLLRGADTHYFLDPERRRLSSHLNAKWLD
ncbi:MAG: hypothetical protein CMH52_05035 [Myxococcales bacterium]|nr:hypothetical protein [Myxococcales bacterium]